jgi:hypothetical protein
LGRKVIQEPQQLPEIHSGSTEDGIYPVSGNTFQPVAIHSVFLLEMAYSRFYCRPAFHPTPDAFRRSASSTLVNMDFAGGVSIDKVV